jgi:ELWxxDGT repeat protein
MRELITLISLICLAHFSIGQVEQVKDIIPGGADGHPDELFNYNEQLLFAAESEEFGKELWISDGTEEGTRLLKDIYAGMNSSDPAQFIEYEDLVYFTAETENEGRELWVTDGTEAGTQLVMDIEPGAMNSSPQDFIIFKDTLWFTAFTSIEGAELWMTDGTAMGTTLFIDIEAGPTGSTPAEKFVSQGSERMYFSASTVLSGNELWATDGTDTGTVLIKDIAAGPANSDPKGFGEAAGIIYFNASTDQFGAEVYRTDGTEEGTSLIKDLYPGPQGSDPHDFTTIGNTSTLGQFIFFVADEDTSGGYLYSYFPGVDTIYHYPNLPGGHRLMNPTNLADYNNLGLYFTANYLIEENSNIDTLGRELLFIDVFGDLTDSSSSGAISVMSLINEKDASFGDIVLDTLDFYYYYSVNTDRFGTELYRTPLFGSFTSMERLSDINERDGDSEIDEITPVGKQMFFEADDGSTGNELYAFQAELGEIEVLRLPNFIDVFPGDTIDMGLVELGTDTILEFIYGRATPPTVRVEVVEVEGDGYFVAPILPITFYRRDTVERDTFMVNYVASAEGSEDIGIVRLYTDYAALDTFTFYIKAQVEGDVAARNPFAPDWKLAPNPVLDQLQLSGSPLQKEGQGYIMNAQGQIIHIFSMKKHETEKQMDMGALPSGQYFIYLNAEEMNMSMIPFVKG